MKKSSASVSKDKYIDKRQKFYMDGVIIDAFDELCRLDGKTRSQVLNQLVKARIRSRAKVLRTSGYAIPQEVFA